MMARRGIYLCQHVFHNAPDVARPLELPHGIGAKASRCTSSRFSGGVRDEFKMVPTKPFIVSLNIPSPLHTITASNCTSSLSNRWLAIVSPNSFAKFECVVLVTVTSHFAVRNMGVTILSQIRLAWPLPPTGFTSTNTLLFDMTQLAGAR